MKMQSIILAIKDGSFSHRLWLHLFFTKKIYKIYDFFHPQKINQKKIVMCNFGGRGYGCNPKYIAEYILKNNLDYELVWLVDFKNIKKSDIFPEKIRLVELFSKQAVKELSSAGVWIDNCRKGWFPRKKKSQLYIQTWHGGFAGKKIEKDAPYLSKPYVKMAKRDSVAIDLIVTDSNVSTAIFKNSFWYSGKIFEFGTPRTDIFFDTKKISAFTERIHNEYKIVDSKKIALYAPTFRQSLSLEPYMLDYEFLQKSLEEKFGGEWQICIRLHPNLAERVKELSLPENIVDFSGYSDIQELLCASDVVVTDYSSLMFDYWHLNRPVFLFATDYEEYTKNDRDFYVPIEKLPFCLAKNNDELQEHIKSFDSENYLKKLSEFKAEYKIVADGHACEKVINWLENKCAEIERSNV